MSDETRLVTRWDNHSNGAVVFSLAGTRCRRDQPEAAAPEQQIDPDRRTDTASHNGDDVEVHEACYRIPT